jgi:hypothetical protein
VHLEYLRNLRLKLEREAKPTDIVVSVTRRSEDLRTAGAICIRIMIRYFCEDCPIVSFQALRKFDSLMQQRPASWVTVHFSRNLSPELLGPAYPLSGFRAIED